MWGEDKIQTKLSMAMMNSGVLWFDTTIQAHNLRLILIT